MATQIQIRRDTLINWLSSTKILSQGELGLDLNSNRIKIGDGVNYWSGLTFYGTQPIEILNITGYTELTLNSNYYVRCSGTTYNLVLPPNAPDGVEIHIKKVNSGTISVVPSGADTIEYVNQKDILEGYSLYLIKYLGNWEIN